MARFRSLSSLAVLMFCTVAAGQETKSVPEIWVQIGEWSLTPTLVDGDVQSFLALRDSASSTEVNAIWYLLTNGTWDDVAWLEDNRWGVINYVKKQIGLSDAFDEHWRIPGSGEGVEALSPSAGAVRLSPIIGSIEQCAYQGVLNAYAAGIEAEVAHGLEQPGIGAETTQAQMAIACLGVCFPWTTYTRPSNWSEWSCGPWAPDPYTPGPIAIPGCQANCHYVRTATRTRWRVAIKVCLDCSIVGWTQTQTQTGTQTGRCTIDLLPNCVVTPATTCPAEPCNDSSNTCQPSSSITTSSWSDPPGGPLSCP
jgi:hypothetical protein